MVCACSLLKFATIYLCFLERKFVVLLETIRLSIRTCLNSEFCDVTQEFFGFVIFELPSCP